MGLLYFILFACQSHVCLYFVGEHKGPELLEDARHQGLESNAEKCVYESEEPLLTTQNTDNTEQSTDSSGELSGSKHPLYAVKVSTEDHINSHRQEQSTKVAKTVSHNAMNNSENAFHYHNDNANISGLPSNGQFVFRDGQYISKDLQANVPREHGQMIFSGRLRDSCSSTSLQDEHLGAAEVMARMNCLEKDDDLLSVGDPQTTARRMTSHLERGGIPSPVLTMQQN